ncbi:glycosyl transferase (plasmid) [Mycobacterium sp. JS623]|uniref:glycosyltransferase n=1 Tax=Mycobacterium sp. JS623 TaxID=212767 RepID=UPI0002A551D3|nr:glycosyltransferase family 2 protein [Mycobacterium sp. JS623]AGB26975.1 glycosyl transferase [Mycobacterium sp. JS623]
MTSSSTRTPISASAQDGGHAGSPGAQTVSVVVAAHSEDRWPGIVNAIKGAQAQIPPPLEVILVVDHNPALAQRARTEISGVTTVENTDTRGASTTRNIGVENSAGEIIVFLDDDQTPIRSDWISMLCRHFDDPLVLGVGGGLVPDWPDDIRPQWFPGEFDWVISTSYIGMPETVAPIRNVWGGNTAIRRSVFLSVGGFRSGFGKVGHVSRPEDTDLCLRIKKAHPSGVWLYDPDAEVLHLVPPQRSTRKYFLRRCWQEGRGKAALVQLVGPDGIESERDYTTKVLPRGLRRELRTAFRSRDVAALDRCGAIVIGFGTTAAGWVAEVAAIAASRAR